MRLPDRKNIIHKEQHDRRHRITTGTLPELQPRQDVLFLSSDQTNTYMQGTVKSSASQPRSYLVRHQGRQYLRGRHHIHILDYTAHSPIPRPTAHQEPATHTPITAPATPSIPPQASSNPKPQQRKQIT